MKKLIALEIMFICLILAVFLSSCQQKHEHSFGEWEITQEATCTTNGIEMRVCECGEKETKEIAATGHTFGEWKITKKETCTLSGKKERICDCGASEIEEIKEMGHTWEKATCTVPKRCSACGKTSGTALGHNKGSNSYCTRCHEKMAIDMNTVVGIPKTQKENYLGFCFWKNTADGIKVCWEADNLSKKSIKYYTVTLYFYNAVGDPAYSEITGKSSKTIKFVGPISSSGKLVIYSIVDYVPVCSKVVIGEITLEYSDGTTDTGWYGHSTTYQNSAIK